MDNVHTDEATQTNLEVMPVNSVKTQAVELLLCGSRGIYIPQVFCSEFDVSDWQISENDVAICLAGPDHESYWDAWSDILRDAKHIKTGHSLYQDGDLFALNYNDMTREELSNFGSDSDLEDNWIDTKHRCNNCGDLACKRALNYLEPNDVRGSETIFCPDCDEDAEISEVGKK